MSGAEGASTGLAMRRPPWSVLTVGALFIALGCLDLYRGGAPLVRGGGRLAGDDGLVLLIGVAALVGAVFLIRGHNWARWLLVAWMALHVAISVDNPLQFMVHGVIFGLLALVLFQGQAAAYFRRGAATEPA
jgi:hypothetical protein